MREPRKAERAIVTGFHAFSFLHHSVQSGEPIGRILKFMCSRNAIQTTDIRDVFMTSMAFVVPLHRLKKEYRRRITIPLSNQLPFVYNFTADFRTYPISRHNPLAHPDYVLFHYMSFNNTERTVRVYPYLVRYRIGNHQPNRFAIVLLAEVDKVFDSFYLQINDVTNFCTQDDIVSLKRSFYETGNNGLYTNENGRVEFSQWLSNLVVEISGRLDNHWRHPIIAGSVVNIDAQHFNVNGCLSKHELDVRFTHAYYGSQNSPDLFRQRQIQDFLFQNIDDLPTQRFSEYFDMERFVYGLLYSNDNYRRVHDNSTHIVDDIYSNNVAEQYWAIPDNIVYVKAASPFANVNSMRLRELHGDLHDVNCLLELCMCLTMEDSIRELAERNLKMTPREMESRRATIAEYFDDSIFNLQELDNRKNYFIRRFGLRQRFEDLINVIQPRLSLMDRLFNRWNIALSLTIAFLTLLVTFLTIFK